jgi:hypothetical protein
VLDTEDAISEKFLDIKIFMRIGSDGQPQLIRMEPMVTADNTFIPSMVRVYIDEESTPTVLTRDAAYLMLENTNCVPIEEAMRYKHLMRN